MKTCFIFVNIEFGKEMEFKQELEKISGTEIIFETNIAAYDFIVKVIANTDEELRNIVFKIRDIKSRRSTLTLTEKSSWRKEN